MLEKERAIAWIELNEFNDLKALEAWIVSEKIILQRSSEVQQAYDRKRENTELIGKSYEDAVRQDVFTNVSDSAVLLSPRVCLTKNIFPVKLPSDTEHWNLWIDNPHVTQEEINQLVGQALQAKNWSHQSTIIWEKHINNRSVPEIRHLHFYVKVV